ncbi:MAG: DUF6538 domain-containing protein [Magnetospirillum sp.]
MTKTQPDLIAVDGEDHLYLRRTKYYLVLKVPKAMVAHFGRQQIREALGTDSLEAARKACRDRAFFWKKEFDRVEALIKQATQPLSYLTLDDDTAQALLWRARFVWDGHRRRPPEGGLDQE